jgi:DNA-binding XRE family transcriptional regulator
MLKLKPKNRIKEIRDLKRMKQSVLAKRVGIFQSEISEIETGERKPNVYLARKIAKALGYCVDDMFLP